MHCGLVFVLFMGIPSVVKAFKNGKCDTRDPSLYARCKDTKPPRIF